MAKLFNRKHRASAMISALLLVWGSPSYGEGHPRLFLAGGTERIALMEELPLIVSLANEGTDDFTYSPMLFRDASFPGSPAGVRILRPDGSVILLRDPIYEPPHDGEPLPPAGLEAGGVEVFGFALGCQWGIFEPVFDNVGEYRLTAYYEGGDWRAESNEIRVIVTPPPQSEVDALRMLRDSRLRCALYAPEWIFTRPAARREALTRTLEQIATLGGSRIYASYARLALAEGHLMLAKAENDPARCLAYENTAGQWLDMIDFAGFTMTEEVEKARNRLAALRRTGPPSR